MKRLLPASLAVLLACALPLAAEPFSVEVGGPEGPRASFAFDPGAQPGKIVIRTDEAGVTGSRLRVRIDRAPTPAWEHVFREGECRFPEGRPSVCEVAIPEDDPSFRQIVLGFKKGLQAHVTIEDAGVMKMQRSVSLRGFTRRYEG